VILSISTSEEESHKPFFKKPQGA